MFSKMLTSIIRAPKFVGILIIFLCALGFFTYRSLRVDLFPPLNFPILNIITELPSYSSLEMERQVTLPIESAVGGVLGVTRVRSTSATGISMVSAEFEWGTNVLLARQLLLESLGAIRSQLPKEAEPTIENLSAALAMIEGYSLQGGDDPVKLRDMAVYDLKPRLQRVPGVYKVIVMGGKILEYSVKPSPYLMIKYDVTLNDIKDALSNNNILASPGVVNDYTQELVLHANGQFADASEIEDVVIAVKSGIPVHIRDVAKVTRAYQYERGDTSEKGSPSVLINIFKQPAQDTETVARRVAEEVGTFGGRLPKDFTVHNYYDQAQLVHDSIGSVKESVIIGGVLVVIVLAFFLHSFRTTVIATLSIPISVIAAIIMMRLFGFDLNIMSLGGLAIGTGIIVDDTIVVLENIFRWFGEPGNKGKAKIDVIVGATHEVFKPVLVSTFTNIAIFLPMVLVEGFAGRLFSPVSFTVTFALLASLVVAITAIPVFANLWLHQDDKESSGDLLHKFYKRPLHFAMANPKRIFIITIIPLLAVALIYKHLEVEFLPALDEGAVLLQTIMPPGTSLTESRRLNLKLEEWLKKIPDVVTVVRRTGHAPGAEDTDSVNHSDVTIKLKPKNERALKLDKLIDRMREKTVDIPGIIVNYLMPLADKINDALGGVPADLGIDIFGPDLDKLRELSNQLVKSLNAIPGISDLRPPPDIPVPSLEVTIDKKAAGKLGIPVSTMQDTMQAFSSGLVATKIREVQKEVGVVIHFSAAGQNYDAESLQSLPLRTTGGSTVPLEQVAKTSFGNVPSEIYHDHLSRKVTITSNIKDRSTSDVVGDVKKAIKDLNLPTGYSWGFSGKYATEQNALSNMTMVLLLAIFVVAVILWIEFRSWLEVALILLTLPLAAIGAIFGLWICRETINVSSMIGAIMLVGIVVRNGIMLLDYFNAGRKAGKSVQDAITDAAQKRVRPILMTASVTILGLFPIAIGWGSGSELLRPLAIAVIGGLLTSTLLTLVVLPSATKLVLRQGRKH